MKAFRDNVENILSHTTELLGPIKEKILFTRLVRARQAVEELESRKRRTTKQSSQLGIARRQVKLLRGELTTSNIPLIVAMSKKAWKGRVSQQDLIADGMTTLINCIDKYNPDTGYRFSTYVSRALFNMMSRSMYCENKQHTNRTYDSDGSLQANLPSTGQNNIDTRTDITEILGKNTANLTDLEAFVLRNRYGIGDAEQCTLYELSNIIQMTREGVRLIEHKAMKKLRNVLQKSYGNKKEENQVSNIVIRKAIRLYKTGTPLIQAVEKARPSGSYWSKSYIRTNFLVVRQGETIDQVICEHITSEVQRFLADQKQRREDELFNDPE